MTSDHVAIAALCPTAAASPTPSTTIPARWASGGGPGGDGGGDGGGLTAIASSAAALAGSSAAGGGGSRSGAKVIVHVLPGSTSGRFGQCAARPEYSYRSPWLAAAAFRASERSDAAAAFS